MSCCSGCCFQLKTDPSLVLALFAWSCEFLNMHEAVGNCSIHMYLLSNCFVFNLVLDLTCTFQLILHVHLANMYFSNISILKTFKFCFFNKIKKGSIDLKEIETLVIFASKLNIYYCVIVFYTWPSIRKFYENAAFKLI